MTRRPGPGQPIRTVMIVAKIGPPEGVEIATQLAEWLGSRDIGL